jgi:hypothetical protein
MSDPQMPRLETVRETVLRMEARLGELPAPLTQELLSHYRALLPRFAADLPSEREQLLSRAAVLMLIQAAREPRA